MTQAYRAALQHKIEAIVYDCRDAGSLHPESHLGWYDTTEEAEAAIAGYYERHPDAVTGWRILRADGSVIAQDCMEGLR